MTLIEVLFYYRDECRTNGREKAFLFLQGAVDAKLHEDIVASVSDEWEFQDGFGNCLLAVLIEV